MRELSLPSGDGIHKLHIIIWEPQQEIKAIVQISHGMTEMIMRYDHFAKYLNKNGILVIGNDHLGHGQTAGSDEDLGYFCPAKMSETVVKDLYSVTKYAKQQYPDIPYFLLGHSMGSFMARRYIMTYGEGLTGAIIVGTGRKSNLILQIGKVTAALIELIKGPRHRSMLLKQASFGNFNNHAKAEGVGGNWLTKDDKIVAFCETNKYCNFSFTVNGYKTLFEVLEFIQKKKNINKIPKKLPIYMLAGTEDPVGDYGTGVKKVFEEYKQEGIKDIRIKLYEGDRHEILNELDKDVVYKDVYQWILQHL